jgi:hypothetical protein
MVLVTAGPAAAATEAEGKGGALSSLGGESKSHPFPLENYGLDEQVQFGITHLGNVFDAVTQWVIQMIWFGLLYVFNGIMVMLQWAFSLDLLQNSMNKLAEALQVMREHIDTPWGLAAVAAMSLWGIWNGLVRKKSIDTLRGLLTSLLCMAALLVVIGNPVETIGSFTGAANGASTEMLSSITSGSVKEPQQAVGSTEETLFNTVILRPWCALQFGDIEYCLSKPKGFEKSVADTWLQSAPDSESRTSLWEQTKEEGAEGERRMEMISGGGASSMARLGLLVLVVVGLVGAIALFTYLAARLLLAALFVLVLAMFAPAMFLVAALGESGRASVVAWATRLLGSILTKVVFALFLAVIVEASNLVTALKLGFFPTWIVFIAFWWGVLLKRKDLLALLSLDPKTASPSGIDFNGAGGGHGLSELFYAKQLMGDVRRGARRVRRGATAAPRAVGRRGKDAAKRALEAGRLGQSDAARQLAHEGLEKEGRPVLEKRNEEKHRAEVARGGQILAEEKRLQSRLTRLDAEIGNKRGRMNLGLRGGSRRPDLEEKVEKRGQAERELLALRSSSAYGRAKSASGSKPREVTQRDVQGWMADRRSELARRADAPENLRAAGIDPEAFKRAGDAQKDRYRATSAELMKRHQGLFDRAGIGHNGDKGEALGFRERRQIRGEMRDGGRLDRFQEVARERARRHRQGFRNERRNERRRRRNVR